MRIMGACLLLFVLGTFSLAAADESDVILQARSDATEDGKSFHPCWWGIGGVAVVGVPFIMTAFFADFMPVEARRLVALAAPAAGGISLSVVGFSTGRAEVSEARIAEIQDRYADDVLVSLYETEYRKALTKIQRRRKGSAVLIGAGATAGAILGVGLVMMVTK